MEAIKRLPEFNLGDIKMKTVEVKSNRNYGKIRGVDLCTEIDFCEIIDGEVSKVVKTVTVDYNNCIFNCVGEVALFKVGKTWFRDWRTNWFPPFYG